MAKNENTSLKNLHTLYMATSGYGKSQTLKRRGGIEKTGARVVLWDNNKDHDAHRFEKLSDFARAVARANKSGKGFRIAYVGEASANAFEIWANIYWEILDGNRITFGVIEEYADCCRGAGALSADIDKYHRRLWTQSRKYGGIIHATSQRPQLVSKDCLLAGVLWAGFMDQLAAKRFASELDISAAELRTCGVGEFYYRNNGSTAEKIKVFEPL